MRIFEVEGDSPQEILTAFLEKEGCDPKFVKTEVLEQGSKGILGIGKKPCIVKIFVDEQGSDKEKAKDYLTGILKGLGFEHTIEERESGNDIIFNILTEDSNLLIGRSALTLDSLQYLVDRIFTFDDDTRILVDVDNYRERVVTQTVEKAVKLAGGVKNSGRPARLSPLATFIRREVHIAIKKIPGVTTQSFGQGPLKTMSILSERRTGKPYFKNKKPFVKR